MNNSNIILLGQFIKVFLGFVLNIGLPGLLISLVVIRQPIHWIYRLGASILIGISLDIALGGLWMLGFGELSQYVYPLLTLAVSLVIFLVDFFTSHPSYKMHWSKELSLFLRSILIVIVVLSVGVAAGFMMTRKIISPQQYFTEFYLLDSNNQLPLKLNSDGNNSILTIGVISHEFQTAEYTILIKQGEDIVGSIGPLDLHPGNMFESNYSYKKPEQSNGTVSKQFIFVLYKDGQPYRTLSMH